MSDVKPVAWARFDEVGEYDTYIALVEDGDYVKYDDAQETVTALQAEIEALRNDAEKKDNLLQECRGHLKGWKMSMLASTPERLLAKIDAAIAKEKQQESLK